MNYQENLRVTLRLIWICALGLIICLTGCQPRGNQAQLPPSAPPRPAVPKPPRVVEVHPTLYVTAGHLNLRSCPGLDCPKITSLACNAEVEKMGETNNWTQVRVKKDGTTGYVISRYLSPQPRQAAQSGKKRPKRAKAPKAHQPPPTPQPAKALQPSEVVEGNGAARPKKQALEPPFPRVM